MISNIYSSEIQNCMVMRWNCNWPEDTLKSLCHEVVKERREMKNCKVVYCKHSQGTSLRTFSVLHCENWTRGRQRLCQIDCGQCENVNFNIHCFFIELQCSAFRGSGWRWDVVDIVGWRKYLYFSENIPGPGFQFQILINTVQGAARAASREQPADTLRGGAMLRTWPWRFH